jgi:hypothetical protein
VRVTLLLADAAQVDSAGKVHALGLGWTVIPTPTPIVALIILLDVDWAETNRPYQVRCELVTDDGQTVTIPGPEGEQTIWFAANIEAGRPPGAPHGTSIRVPITYTVGPGLPLNPGRYQWRVTIEGHPEWVMGESFTVVRPGPGT